MTAPSPERWGISERAQAAHASTPSFQPSSQLWGEARPSPISHPPPQGGGHREASLYDREGRTRPEGGPQKQAANLLTTAKASYSIFRGDWAWDPEFCPERMSIKPLPPGAP